MSLVLTASASMPVVKVGRIAGQFSNQEARPLKKKTEKNYQVILEIILMVWNLQIKQEYRCKRLFRAYSQSASTLNLLRAFSQGGFADLRQVHL